MGYRAFLAVAMLGACGDDTTLLPGPDAASGPDARIVDSDGGGCPVTISAPATTVTTDGDTTKTGVQANVVVTLGSACSGQTVTLSDCDVAKAPLTATAQGTTATFTGVTLCALDKCPVTVRHCAAQVTSAGLTSQGTADITVDTQPPLVAIVAVAPPGFCGGSVATADDVDPNTDGTQVQVRILTVASTRWAETTPPGDGTHIVADASGLATVTLTTGDNTIVGKASDAFGLIGTSPDCTVQLSSLRVTIDTPAANAALGAADGTVSNGALSTQICGTVGEPTTSTVAVTVDGTDAGTGTIDNTTSGHYCATVTLTTGAHTIVATGTSTTGDNGSAHLAVTVDVTAPPPPTGLALTPARRNAVSVAWTAPTDVDGSAVPLCVIKQSPQPIPDIAAFNAIAGTGVNIPSPTAGAAQSTTLTPVKSGIPTYVALRCFDSAQNGSDVLAGGPVTTKATQSATLQPTAVTGRVIDNAQFGSSLAGADLDGDGFADLIVGAPGVCQQGATMCSQQGVVYIYKGSATGAATTPTFILRGTDPQGQSYLGKSVTVVDWNHDGIDDIAVGAPFASGLGGAVLIWLGDDSPTGRWASGSGTTVLDDTTADVRLTPDGTDDWLTGVTAFGWQVRRGDFDGDGRDDLLIGANGTQNGTGGAVIIFGATGTSPTGTIGIPGGLTAAGITGRGYMFDTMTPTSVEYGGYLESLGKLGDGPIPSADTRDDFVVAPVSADFAGKGTAAVTIVVFYGQPQSGTAWTKVEAMDAGNEFITGPIDMGVSDFRFGQALGSVADQDGDGRRDLVITDPRTGFGTVWIVPAGVPGTKAVRAAAWTEIDGTVAGGGLGSAIASPGDIDGDGNDDVVAGSDGDGPGPTLEFWFSGTGQTVHTSVDRYLAPATLTRATTAAWVGDLNDDGVDDLAWGDSRVDEAQPQTGVVQLLY